MTWCYHHWHREPKQDESHTCGKTIRFRFKCCNCGKEKWHRSEMMIDGW